MKTHEIDYMELISVNFGIAGSILLGLFLHFTKLLKTSNAVLGILYLISSLQLFWALRTGYEATKIIYCIIGFVQYPIITLSYIYAVEIAYPLRETTVLSFLRGSCLLFGESVKYLSNHFVDKAKTVESADTLIL